MSELSKKPVVDVAEDNAFFPSEFSLSQFTAPKTDYDGSKYERKVSGKKVLAIMTEERYLLMKNGTFFSTGNHPVETLVPLLHLVEAGFEVDFATISGAPVKFEFWAMPSDDEAVKGLFERYKKELKSPLKLSEIDLDASDYAAVFVPGGHGAMAGVPESADVANALNWAMKNDRHVIAICHGPVAFLATAANGEFAFKGYEMVAFPDGEFDAALVEIGYTPGGLPYFVPERLRALGAKVLNSDIKGAVHKDRKLLTGDSPLASNALGKLAAQELLATFA
ncbi:glyoxalase III HchA [Campylobacter sp. 19-13652]|uniref:glyoxalase III HchA n=1 Tax=Campylobacter sp. 19-13652 TaxID=2840180 RepID=UPI001C7641F5|nr:glyoxalase III HchA [Campylobacter sp. 19-13652]BCX78698.1 protein deglycase HchA [Campylobacter sp. 19-13652]